MADAHEEPDDPAPSEEAFIIDRLLKAAGGDPAKMHRLVNEVNRVHFARTILPLLTSTVTSLVTYLMTAVFLTIGVMLWLLGPSHGSTPPWYAVVSLLLGGGSGTLGGIIGGLVKARKKAATSQD